MSPGEIQKLADDILENGLKESILITHDGVLVDGRNRLRACGVAGVAPRFSRLASDTTEAEILRRMVSANVKTRTFTVGQLAMLGVDFGDQVEHSPLEDFANFPALSKYDHRTFRSYAAKVVGVSTKTVWQARTIVEHDPEMEKEVREGKIQLNTAYERVMTSRGLRNPVEKPIFIPQELPPKPPASRDNSRKGVQGRVAWLNHLAHMNMTSAEIADRLNVSEPVVRRLARKYSITLPADAWSYKRRKPTFDVNRVAQVVADELMSLDDSILKIRDHFADLDPERVAEWGKIYYRTSRQLRNLARALGYGQVNKRTNDNNDDTAA